MDKGLLWSLIVAGVGIFAVSLMISIAYEDKVPEKKWLQTVKSIAWYIVVAVTSVGVVFLAWVGYQLFKSSGLI
ncbi:MAG: hypothetical protein AABY84_07050 [Candidatus Firestonebacteria bacterium]